MLAQSSEMIWKNVFPKYRVGSLNPYSKIVKANMMWSPIG